MSYFAIEDKHLHVNDEFEFGYPSDQVMGLYVITHIIDTSSGVRVHARRVRDGVDYRGKPCNWMNEWAVDDEDISDNFRLPRMAQAWSSGGECV